MTSQKFVKKLGKLLGEMNALFQQYETDAKGEKGASEDDAKVSNDIIIQDYSSKSIVVRGDTKKIKAHLLKGGGKWNPNLKGGPAWIFPKTKFSELQAELTNNEIAFNDETGTLEPDPEPEVQKPVIFATFKADDPTAHKVFAACMKNYSGKQDPKSKHYSFDTSYKAKVEAVLKKHDAKYSVIESQKKKKIIKNEHNNNWDPESKIVFKKIDNQVYAIGVQNEDGSIDSLEVEHIEFCKAKKWKYRKEKEEKEESDIEV